jgi:hypothetical protein
MKRTFRISQKHYSKDKETIQHKIADKKGMVIERKSPSLAA